VQILSVNAISPTADETPVSPLASSPSQKKNSKPLSPSKSPSCSLSPSVSKSQSKNNAILQMSGTKEENKILSDAWDSPEKEQKGNTPLEMVEGIIANLQAVPDTMPLQPALKKAKKTQEPSTSQPAWVTTPRRPLLSSQIHTPNDRMPALIPTSSGMVSTNPPMMQLVNTVNGPMIVPEGTQLQPVHQVTTIQDYFLYFQTNFFFIIQDPSSGQSKSPSQAPPKLLIPTSQCGQPVLVSPGHQLIAIASSQTRGNPNHHQQQQQIIINQVTSISNAERPLR
jgi:hypothetical protein